MHQYREHGGFLRAIALPASDEGLREIEADYPEHFDTIFRNGCLPFWRVKF